MSSMADDQFVCLGVIASAIGVRGEVRVKTFTETPFGLTDYGNLTGNPGGQKLEIVGLREVKGGAGVFLDGITDRDAAEALKGMELGVGRDALGETEDDEMFYHVDLMGLEVRDADGIALGTVKAVHDFGGGDVLELQVEAQDKTELVPFNKDTVPEVNMEGGFLVLLETAWLAVGQSSEGEGE